MPISLLLKGDSISKLGIRDMLSRLVSSNKMGITVSHDGTNNQGIASWNANYQVWFMDVGEFDWLRCNCGAHNIDTTDSLFESEAITFWANFKRDRPKTKIIFASTTIVEETVPEYAGDNVKITTHDQIMFNVLNAIYGSGNWFLDDINSFQKRYYQYIAHNADGLHYPDYTFFAYEASRRIQEIINGYPQYSNSRLPIGVPEIRARDTDNYQYYSIGIGDIGPVGTYRNSSVHAGVYP